MAVEDFRSLGLQSTREYRKQLHQVRIRNRHAKEWWQFAIACVIKDNNQLRNPGSMLAKQEFRVPRQLKRCFRNYVAIHANNFLERHCNNKNKKI